MQIHNNSQTQYRLQDVEIETQAQDWMEPPPGWIKVNVNATFFQDKKKELMQQLQGTHLVFYKRQHYLWKLKTLSKQRCWE